MCHIIITGDQGPKWRRGFAKINLEYFQVIFEAVSSQGKRDNIALDDVRIAECSLFGTVDIRFHIIAIMAYYFLKVCEFR